MNPVAWDAVIILTPQVTRLIGITEEITDKLLEVRVDMEPIFRIVINEDNSRQKSNLCVYLICCITRSNGVPSETGCFWSGGVSL